MNKLHFASKFQDHNCFYCEKPLIFLNQDNSPDRPYLCKIYRYRKHDYLGNKNDLIISHADCFKKQKEITEETIEKLNKLNEKRGDAVINSGTDPSIFGKLCATSMALARAIDREERENERNKARSYITEFFTTIKKIEVITNKKDYIWFLNLIQKEFLEKIDKNVNLHDETKSYMRNFIKKIVREKNTPND